MKRFACVLLAALMIFSAFPAAFFASAAFCTAVSAAYVFAVRRKESL